MSNNREEGRLHQPRKWRIVKRCHAAPGFDEDVVKAPGRWTGASCLRGALRGYPAPQFTVKAPTDIKLYISPWSRLGSSLVFWVAKRKHQVIKKAQVMGYWGDRTQGSGAWSAAHFSRGSLSQVEAVKLVREQQCQSHWETGLSYPCRACQTRSQWAARLIYLTYLFV